MKTIRLFASRDALTGFPLLAFLFLGASAPAAPPGHTSPSGAAIHVGALIPSGEKVPAYQIPRAEAVTAVRIERALRETRRSSGDLLYGDEAVGAVATPTTGGPTGCVVDADCDDCNRCTDDDCVAEVCVNANSDECTLCTDGVFCNGDERCDGMGNCLAATEIKAPPADPCETGIARICDESPLPHIATQPGCVNGCRDDAACNDNNACTGTESCILKRCIDGLDDGNGCETDAECRGSLRCRGLCRATGTPCGEGAPCVADGQNFVCGWGRCCTDAGGGEYACSREKLADCTGRWLGVGDVPETENVDDAPGCVSWGPADPNPGEDFECPKYESGIVDGNIVGTLGEAGLALCRPFSEVGDDYQLINFDPGEFFELRTMRWIGGFDLGTGSRMRIRFYDTAGHLVADTVTDYSFTPGIALRTVTFTSGEAIIPAAGFVTVGPAEPFSPSNLSRWAVTDATGFVGTNDTGNVVVRVGDGSLSVTDAASLGLAGGVLAFELVGDKTPFGPTGACCRAESGICTQELKSACEELGGIFRGVGKWCDTCTNQPFLGCEDTQIGNDPDCSVCSGGDRHGSSCVDDNDCPNGQCTSGECIPSTAGCAMSACCDEIDATCTQVIGGACTGEGMAPCYADDDCPEGEGCEPSCPIGTVAQGFGTSCHPNCCVSPTLANENLPGPFPDTGTPGDTCLAAEANRLLINVPPPGETETFTISGNNKNATFGDFADGTCPSGIFNPDRRTRDRGYWIAFETDACADVRIDFCCTNEVSGEVHQPQWAFLYADCNPCSDVVTPSLIESLASSAFLDSYPDPNPVGYGFPFCASDDPWQTYRSLPAGTYYLPVYSAPGGHFGQFQAHVSITGCPLAACCLPEPVCDGGSTPGAGCTQNSDCPDGGVCRQECQLVNELECAALNGYWRGFLPGSVGQDPVPTCGPPHLCAAGVCDSGPKQGETCLDDGDCGPPSICAFGACCYGPASCEDSAGQPPCDPTVPGSCIDVDLCTASGGESFHGGARCDSPVDPCPACDFTGESNCQIPSVENGYFHMYMSDLTMPPHGVAVADDFRPIGESISRVCVWGLYLDPNDYPGDCSDAVADKFRVRIYADDDIDENPVTPNQPGELVAERFVSGGAAAQRLIQLTYLEPFFEPPGPLFGYSLDLGTPVTFPAPNEVYWLEVANITSHPAGADVNDPAQASFNTCYWHWVQVFQEPGQGNNYAHTGTDDRPIEQQVCRGGTAVGLPCDSDSDCVGGGACVAGGNGYFGDWRSARGTDFAFCLGDAGGAVPFQTPEEPLGVCCLCESPFWQFDRTLNECRDGIGDADPDITGSWYASNDYYDCVQQLGDNCGTFGAVATDLDCTPVMIPGGALQMWDGLYVYETTCTENSPAPELLSGNFLVEDVYTEYVATCTGQLYISGCASGTMYGGFDSYVAIYHRPANPTVCICPSSNFGLVADEDESCNGYGDGGSGIAGPFFVVPGDCYMIRAGGWSDTAEGSSTSHGSGVLDIQCIPDPCTRAAPPLQETATIDGITYGIPKVRHLAIRTDPSDAGEPMALRVRVLDLPPGHEANEGLELYVGPPRRICENAGQVDVPIPANPPTFGCAAGGGGPISTWIAPLQSEPFYMDWHGRCVDGGCIGGLSAGGPCTTTADCAEPINVYSSILAPSWDPAAPSRFEASAIKESCGPPNELYFSDPLEITLSRWGDVLRDNTTNPPRPPNNSADISDVIGILNKFKNIISAPKKARADIEPACPDHLVQISDVTRALDAFAGKVYPFPPGDPNAPCP